MRRLAICLALVIATVTGAQANSAYLSAINSARAQSNRAPLIYDQRLEAAARAHARDMARAGFFGHRGSDRSRLGVRITRTGYDWCFAAENIAAGQRSLQAVMSAWMGSRGHRKNILQRKASAVGMARTPGDHWVMVLAAPCAKRG